MKTIEFEQDGYEIVIDILNADKEEPVLEADVYYKDFDDYKIYILAANEQKLVQVATSELLQNHPFEKIIQNYEAQ